VRDVKMAAYLTGRTPVSGTSKHGAAPWFLAGRAAIFHDLASP
jgi:hypothetical protein